MSRISDAWAWIWEKPVDVERLCKAGGGGVPVGGETARDCEGRVWAVVDPAILHKLEAVADAARGELPHLEKSIRELESQGLCAGALPGVYRGLSAALDALDAGGDGGGGMNEDRVTNALFCIAAGMAAAAFAMAAYAVALVLAGA